MLLLECTGRIDSLVKRITGFADMIQLTHLKLQQVMSTYGSRWCLLQMLMVQLNKIQVMVTNYNPQEALNMFFQTGLLLVDHFTSDGDMNPGKVPIQEIIIVDLVVIKCKLL